MAIAKTKTSRAVKTGSSTIPSGPIGGSTCGHSGCERTCRVRYAGPTSPLHNEHIIHAARGASQVWTAAIVAGLAVVLTGAIAFSAVQAETDATDPTTLMLLSLRRIEMRLDRIEPKINKLVAQQASQQITNTQNPVGLNTTSTMTGEDHKPEVGMSNVCVEQCGTTYRQCQATAIDAYNQCTITCIPGANMGETMSLDSCKKACGDTKEKAVHTCTETGTTCKNSCPKK